MIGVNVGSNGAVCASFDCAVGKKNKALVACAALICEVNDGNAVGKYFVCSLALINCMLNKTADIMSNPNAEIQPHKSFGFDDQLESWWIGA